LAQDLTKDLAHDEVPADHPNLDSKDRIVLLRPPTQGVPMQQHNAVFRHHDIWNEIRKQPGTPRF
jgi:hypothetical protein